MKQRYNVQDQKMYFEAQIWTETGILRIDFGSQVYKFKTYCGVYNIDDQTTKLLVAITDQYSQ